MLKFKNTSELEPLGDILGQRRAKKAMEMGLKIENSAYNIYLAGEPGTGKTTYALKILNEYASKKNSYKDWCYVYNFENNKEPIIIELKVGMGKELKKDIENLIETLLDELKDAFESEEFEVAKNKLIDDYECEKDALIKEIKKYADERGFKLKNSKVGMVFIPKEESKEDDEVDVDIDEEEADEEFDKVKKELESLSIKIVYKIRKVENIAKEELLNLEEEISKFIIDHHIGNLITKYDEYDKVKDYLLAMKENILEYAYLFYLDEEELKDKYDKEHFNKYKVNVFIDNSGNEQDLRAPIIIENNPNVSNLFGKVEYDYYNSIIKTDFTKLIPGAVHKANGGYLVLYIEQLLRYPLCWDMLKRAIQSKEIGIETQISIEPKRMPIDIKIILIGSHYLYRVLSNYDSDFNKYFKVFVDFEDEMKKNDDNEEGVARFIAYQCEKNKLKHFTYEAVEEVIKFSVKITGDKYNLSTEFNKIMEIVIESDMHAQIRESEFVDKEDVKKAITERKDRFNRIEERLDESVENGYTLIDTQGSRVGVINGLSVIQSEEYSFGRPSRITVSTSTGNKGIVNIEREVNMSGPIHNKGVLILSGYLGENFAQDTLLSLNAYVCFEQNYGGIDGDSATVAELCAILSSLSQIPLKQSIAITGSMNQKGEVQVVGGISEKIEGFYRVCKIQGLSGNQGVIIPKNNMRNVVLSDDITEDIENGKFNIYAIESVEEAIEILTEVEFTQIKELVKERLKKFSEIDDE